MQINELITHGADRLASSPSARLDAEVLLAFVLSVPREDLLAKDLPDPTPDEVKKYEDLLTKRAQHMPVAYLTHCKDFYGLSFEVNENVLIPRPETEALVELAIHLAKEKSITTLYDIGTGSGNIAISLAKHLPQATIVASDISESALEVARRNAAHHDVLNQIHFVMANLAEHIESAELIVANLPYIPDTCPLSPDIKHEPTQALFAGTDGLELYRQMLRQPLFDRFTGTVLLELGSEQIDNLIDWVRNYRPNAKTQPIRNIDQSVCGLRLDFA